MYTLSGSLMQLQYLVIGHCSFFVAYLSVYRYVCLAVGKNIR